jgi:hypothetical protein
MTRTRLKLWQRQVSAAITERRGDMLLASQLFSPTQLEYSRRDLLRLPTLARLGYSYYAPGRQLSKKERPHQSAIGEAEIDPQRRFATVN